MFVEHLQLTDFRSYAAVDVPLTAGVTTFVGPNGQGKTNLVEAVEYLASLGSHRVSTDAPLVRAGTERAVIRARARAGLHDTRQLHVEVEISPGKANRAKLNRSPVRRPRDILGAVRCVLFAPDDLAIVKGDPAERRRFLDELLIARWPRFAGVKADYDRLLRQRNTLLKSLAGRSRTQPAAETAATLDVWDAHLARTGAELLEGRLVALSDLSPHVSKAYADIAPANNDAIVEYRTALDLTDSGGRDDLQARLVQAMQDRRADELQRGVSLVGPHRDDISLALGTLPAKGYASHGESWSYALALKLGCFQLLRADGVEPVLVLDDVFAELDLTRRARLAGAVTAAEQVLVTAAVEADVPAELRGRRFRVSTGEVVAE